MPQTTLEWTLAFIGLLTWLPIIWALVTILKSPLRSQGRDELP